MEFGKPNSIVNECFGSIIPCVKVIFIEKTKKSIKNSFSIVRVSQVKNNYKIEYKID